MSMSSVTDPMVGYVVGGRYEITGRIARGGMAVVYQATDVRLSRTVAVKLMHDSFGDDPEFTRKFDREARAAAQLSQQPTVVSVFDQGSDHGRPFIVMEHVEGCTLRSLVTRQAPLPPLRALSLMEPVLAALATAHRHGIVHRDMKPENVLISTSGHVKVTDFGLAKAVSGDTVTVGAGMVMGTVSYIPPELVQRGHCDPRSDVYSAGIMLFELLTGSKPYSGDSPITIAYAHCNRDVPPPSSFLGASTQDRIPAYVDALVQAATSRDAARRPADGADFLARLRRARLAVERGVTRDPGLEEEMRRGIGACAGEPTVALPETPNRSAMMPVTTAAPVLPSHASGATRIPPATGPSRWVPRSSRAGSATVTPSLAPRRQHTPVEPPAPSLGMPAPRDDAHPSPSGPAAVTRVRRRPRHRGAIVLLLVLLLALLAGVGAWWGVSGRFVKAPALIGLSREAAAGAAARDHVGVDFDSVYSETEPAGHVVGTDPAAGTSVLPGTTIHAHLSQGPERYPVPDLAGLTGAEADAAIAAARLDKGTVTEAWSDTVAAGHVTDFSPAAGSLSRPHTPVSYVLSRGPEPVSLPDLTGSGRADAIARLTALGLKTTVSEAPDDTVAAGFVVAQNPGATASVHRGDTVALTVSTGPAKVRIPDVRGKSTADAKRALTDAGFKVVVKGDDNPLAFGLVANADPASGTEAAKGSTVTIYVV